MKNLSLLGCTGSIGTSALDVVRQHPDSFSIQSVSAWGSWQKTAEICKEFNVPHAVMFDEQAADLLQAACPQIKVETGLPGLISAVTLREVDTVLNGLVGSIGCLPTIEALKLGKQVALANKETMVMAGELVQSALASNPAAALLPVDSEHSAIFQCLQNSKSQEVESIILTASGGPFRTLPAQKFAEIDVATALKHPNWSMGPKITIDSATLMNKGLEVIEAHYLFGVAYEQIEVVVHPQSIIHSMVQFVDGNVLAQLGTPDMKMPIQYALSWPRRIPLDCARLNMPKLKDLTFEEPDKVRFPCLRLAYEAGKKGGVFPAALNAANEVLVPAFLAGHISFLNISAYLEELMADVKDYSHPDMDTILKVDKEMRILTSELIAQKGSFNV
jgi:1-deoxy-D-xylulose-5-phosphate reductoisomerase